jgi:hypothetical protein
MPAMTAAAAATATAAAAASEATHQKGQHNTSVGYFLNLSLKGLSHEIDFKNFD